MTGAHGSGIESPEWVTDVLQFWFSDLDEARWFAKDCELDEQIRQRFLPLHEQLVADEGRDLEGARPLLAAVVVLDQFSRNLFRDSARAFSADPLARRLARQAIAKRYDDELRTAERYFLYLPFEHSEITSDQAFAVELISSLENDQWTMYALAHQSIIDRFGRFPHRNTALGRTSTAEEIALLQQPLSAF
jgi:uncharacterized protein (DUF924 family)